MTFPLLFPSLKGDDIFEVDTKGIAELHAGRPPFDLIRELKIQQGLATGLYRNRTIISRFSIALSLGQPSPNKCIIMSYETRL